MDGIKEYLEWRDIPRELSLRVRRYYQHYYTKRSIVDEATILGSLTPKLQSEVNSRANSSVTSPQRKPGEEGFLPSSF